MSKARTSKSKRTLISKLLSVAKSYRQQIGVIAVAATLGLVIILNVAMAPETELNGPGYHMTYFKDKTPQNATVIR